MSAGVRNFPKVVLGTIERVIRTLKGLRGASDGFVGTDQSGIAEQSHLGTGTADNTTYLRGDGTWATPPGAGTAGDVVGDTVPTVTQDVVAYTDTTGKHVTPLTGTQGDILYFNGTAWKKLGAGTSGQLLKTNGAGANPAWTTSGTGTVIGDDLSPESGSLVAYADGTGLHVTEMPGSQGQVLYHNGTKWTTLAVGTDGYVLASQGAAANPRWIPAYNSIYVDNVTDLEAAVNAAVGGETICIAAGTYTLTGTLVLDVSNLRLVGAGKGNTILRYTADANTDLISIRHTNVTVEGLSLYGAASPANGAGAVGTGRGIVIAQPDAASGGPSWDYCGSPTIRNVEILCTGSWCIYDSGVAALTSSGTRPALAYTYPLIASNKAVSVQLTIEDCDLSFPNSDGCLYIGSGAAAPNVKNLKTNSYSYNTYTHVISAGGTTADMGSVHLYNVVEAHFDKPIFQSPAIQIAGTAVDHYDNDATMFSFLNCYSLHVLAPYFEVLSSECNGTHPDGGSPAGTSTAGRTHWFITGINSHTVKFDKPYFRSNVRQSGALPDGYALRIMKTPADSNVGVGVQFEGGVAVHYRLYYDGAAVPPRTATAPNDDGGPIVIDRDDFVFGGGTDGEEATPIRINGLVVQNVDSGHKRWPSTPASPDSGYSIMYGPNVSFSTLDRRVMQLGINSENGSDDVDDARARWAQVHEIGAGVMAYCNSSGILSGLWLSDRGNDFRQIPFIRYGTTAYTGPLSGDLWYNTTTRVLRTYDGNNWKSMVGLIGTSSIAARTTSLGSTTLLTGNANSAGMYRVTYYIICTTGGSGGDKVEVFTTFNDGVAAQTRTLDVTGANGQHGVHMDLTTTNASGHGTEDIYVAASQNIAFYTTVTSAGSAAYSVEARLEAIG